MLVGLSEGLASLVWCYGNGYTICGFAASLCGSLWLCEMPSLVLCPALPARGVGLAGKGRA